MGALLKLIDAILFLLFALIAVATLLIDAQLLLPRGFYPMFLVDLKETYTRNYNDYLLAEKPHFFIGIVWLELVFRLPLCLVNLFGLLGGKPWFNTTCLIYGVTVFSSMAASLGELVGSGKASEKLLKVYYLFMGLGVLAFLRGLISSSSKPNLTLGKRPVLGRKKKA